MTRIVKIMRLLSGLSMSVVLSACSFTNTEDYNACAMGLGLTGLGVGLISSGTGAVIAGAAGGAGLGIILCDEEPELPEQRIAQSSPAMAAMAMQIEPEPIGDSDADGIRDDRDRCPETPAGVEVDYKGCAKPLVFDNRVLTFAFNSAKLDSGAADVLMPVINALARYPNARFEVSGHTDSKGSERYNQSLSERRAAAVVEQLLAMGVDPTRLESKGYGESNPVSSNETETGRSRNRRVEVRLIDD